MSEEKHLHEHIQQRPFKGKLVSTKMKSHQQNYLIVKESVNKDTEDFMTRCKPFIYWRRTEEVDLSNYGHNNHDGLPIVPKEKLTEEEEDKLLWETFRNIFKGSKAVTLLSKAREMLGMEV
uniref:Uncharacterized protein n=2 Tax=Rhizophagus irregularis TaxID=588596 RepID=U9V086_RHIID